VGEGGNGHANILLLSSSSVLLELGGEERYSSLSLSSNLATFDDWQCGDTARRLRGDDDDVYNENTHNCYQLSTSLSSCSRLTILALSRFSLLYIVSISCSNLATSSSACRLRGVIYNR